MGSADKHEYSDDEFVAELRKALDSLASSSADEGDPITVLAKTCGVSRPTIARWIVGENDPHPALRPALVRALRKISEK